MRHEAFWQHRTEAIYREFRVYQGLAPVEPCPWTLEQAMAYRRGQRERDRLDRAARLAARYFPEKQAESLDLQEIGVLRQRLMALERDISGLNSHRHQGDPTQAERPQTKRRIDL